MAVDSSSRSTPAVARAGRFGATLFGLFFMMMGLLFIGLMTSDAYRNMQARGWEKTPCVITESRVETVSDGYAVLIRYRYEKKGRSYDSGQIKIGVSRLSEKNIGRADALAAKYHTGKKSRCYVNPADPAQAVLEHKSFWVLLFIPIPLIFVVIGGGIIYGVWRGKKIRAKTDSLSSIAARKRLGRPAAGVLFLVLFVAGGALGYFVFFPAVYKSFTSGNWIAADCVVQSSRVQRHESDDGTTYSVDIAYTYVYQGHTYRSNRYKFIGGSSSGYYGKAEVVKQYPKGGHATCYINPSDPSEAVLKRELGAEIFFGLIPLVFMLVGFFGFVYLVRERSGKTGVAAIGRKGVSEYAPDRFRTPAGPRVLKPETSYFGKIMGSIGIAIFWNGIVSVFLFQAVQSFRAGHPDYFLSLFMIPFVLIGLGMIGAVFYFILASFNPRPEIRLSTDRVRLGDRVGITWTTVGNVNKIRNFSLVLIGEESATYQRGTDTCTDKDIFYSQDLVQSYRPQTVRKGDAEFTIPSDSMHTFKSDNNAVTWKIRMHCGVPMWPDTRDDFDIPVFPLLTENA